MNAPLMLFHLPPAAGAVVAAEPTYQPLQETLGDSGAWDNFSMIRQFLVNQTLPADHWFGFLPADFLASSQLTPGEVAAQVLAASTAGADVVLFADQPDMGALFLNVFEQAEAFDPGFIAACEGWLRHLGLSTPPLGQWVMDSRQIVLGNRFVAKPAFWREWLRFCESLTHTAEQGPDAVRSPLLKRKDALMERVASLVLSLQPQWRSWAANPFAQRWSDTRLSEHRELAVMSDALKRAYRDLGFPCYLTAYARLRERLMVANAAVARLAA